MAPDVSAQGVGVWLQGQMLLEVALHPTTELSIVKRPLPPCSAFPEYT